MLWLELALKLTVLNSNFYAMATKLSGSQDIDIFKDEKDGKLREVGNQAVWSLSSCKPG